MVSQSQIQLVRYSRGHARKVRLSCDWANEPQDGIPTTGASLDVSMIFTGIRVVANVAA
jgi:hypothetical protein